MVVKLARLTHK